MRYLTLIALSFLSLLSGCALLGFGGSGDTAPPKAKGYDLSAPSDWKAVEKADGDKAYRLPSGNLVTVTSSCVARNNDVSPEILTRHLLFGARNVVVDRKEKWIVQETEGLFTTVRATLDGSPIYLELFVLPKAGCVFDFGLIGPKTLSEKDSREFQAFVKSFRYGKS